MKKYNCEYRDGHKLNIGNNWEKKGILASNHKEAYEKFIQEVGLYPKSVTVSSGLLGVWKEFDNHLEAAKERVSTDTKDLAKSGGITAETSTEKLLLKILDSQQKQLNLNKSQFEELKKLNYKLWSFWIFFIGLPILAWIIIAVNS